MKKIKEFNPYTPDGWIDFEAIRSFGMPFNFIWSERGPGKTYGVLKSVLDNNEMHILMRRTETELAAISFTDLSPYQPVLDDHPELGPITIRSIPKISAAYQVVRDDNVIGYTLAMATARNVRGFDLSKCSVLIYDEFIPERHARPIKEEGTAFLNVIETINRNRELKGGAPLQVFCTGNANDIDNAIFSELGLINIAYNMQESGKQLYVDRSRGLLLFNAVGNDVFTNAKRKTSLYKLVGDNSAFTAMALDNKFTAFSSDRIKTRNLIEYKLLAQIGELFVYKHKSNTRYYISTRAVGTPKRVYSCSAADIKHGCQDHYYLVHAYLTDRVDCEDAATKVIFERYYKLS